MREKKTSRAWVITTMVGMTLLAVSAAVFAITTTTARVAGDSKELHRYGETLRLVTVVRAGVANAVHFDSLERNLKLDIGDSTELAVTSTASTIESLQAYLSAGKGTELIATQGFVGLSSRIIVLVQDQDPSAQDLAEAELVGSARLVGMFMWCRGR